LCGALTQVAAALDFLNLRRHHMGSWSSGIQHLNIQPSNFLMFGETVMVSDYHLALPTPRTLHFGARIGTPAYMAPAVWQRRLPASTHHYARAVSYSSLPTGQPPINFHLPHPGQLPPPRPAPDLSLLTDKERPIIAKALSTASHQRWGSCGELIANLTK